MTCTDCISRKQEGPSIFNNLKKVVFLQNVGCFPTILLLRSSFTIYSLCVCVCLFINSYVCHVPCQEIRIEQSEWWFLMCFHGSGSPAEPFACDSFRCLVILNLVHIPRKKILKYPVSLKCSHFEYVVFILNTSKNV